jgi:hypothetical protein
MLPPGWHVGLWPWKYKVTKVPFVEVPPGEIALVVAKDGAAIPGERVLAHEIACDNFQDAVRFLEEGGEKGRQLTILDRPCRINGAVDGRHARSRVQARAQRLAVFRVPSDRVGIIGARRSADFAVISQGPSWRSQAGAGVHRPGGCRVRSGASRCVEPEPVVRRGRADPLTGSIGYVGVVSELRRRHLDVSGDGCAHGNLVSAARACGSAPAAASIRSTRAR